MNIKSKILLILTLMLIGLGLKSYSSNFVETKFPIKGDTISNITLQKDTVPTVINAVAYVNKNTCNVYKITDSKVLQQPQNNIWKEEWTVNACNINYYVPITFILDQTGATFSINPKNIYK